MPNPPGALEPRLLTGRWRSAVEEWPPSELFFKLAFREGRLVAVIFVKPNGDSESRIRESIIRAMCDRLVGGVEELEKERVFIDCSYPVEDLNIITGKRNR